MKYAFLHIMWNQLLRWLSFHNQFESIHPFFDGNGLTGRIINILYLVKRGFVKTAYTLFKLVD
ncbi:hypothetical protein FA048_02015 [Pedobacter polaris]|uniref:Fido domain-containing protein n=1 Tax=Pedobacter polaris TaxID=2571273 RepID=A0A4U1CTA9_9SPHI|nr:Fic family protein [Pedobacter polaris]TKC12417.1 hypothetical protein FA048_02015 [Pedobacter polaris]